MFSRFLSLSSFLFVLFPAVTRGDFTIDQNDVDFHGGMKYNSSWKRIVCHCGHSNCDGTMTFTMSQSGSFHVYVKGAEWKSQGATQCKLSINGNQVASGEFKDSNGSKCGNSGGDSDFYIINGQTIDLGAHSFQAGDEVEYWSNTAFQCGTSGPGSYSAFTHLEFKGSGTVEECGNGTCGAGETCGSCPSDCGECPAIDAFSKISAVDYSDQSGTQKESGSEGGESIGYAADGDWLLFSNVDFGAGANNVEARIAGEENGTIEFRLDELDGTKIGEVSTSGTGGWTSWETVSASVDNAFGKHDLYLKWTGGSVNLYWIDFAAGEAPVDPVCGNGECESGETCGNCEQDCGACQTTAECGNGECESGESCSNCEQDCGTCESVSGMFHTDNVPRYAIWEKTVTNSNSYSNPFDFGEIELEAAFTTPSGATTEFFGFYDGDGSGGQDGDVWKVRFMPTEVGTYHYALSFSDGTDIPESSGSFTVVESNLPGPPELMGDNPPASYFLRDARGNPIKWKSYSLAFTAWKVNNGGYNFYEQETLDFMKSAIDEHVIGQGYNATMLESPINEATGPVGLMHEHGKSYHLESARVMDGIVAKLAEEKIWTVNWTAYTTQPGYKLTDDDPWDGLYNNRELLMRYYVARWAPFYNYFGWCPTWETWELTDDEGRTEAIQKKVIEYSPWEKFPTTHDKAREAWTDWQRIQMRQAQSRSVADGNFRAGGWPNYGDYRYVVIGCEDLWEHCGGSHGQPRDGIEVRRALWGELLAGVYPMYSEWRHGGEGAGPCDGNGNGEGDAFNRIAVNFWYDNTVWYEYTMKNDLVDDGENCRCSGKDNVQYFVYDQNGGNNSIDLSGASGSYDVTWYNPLTGDSESGATVNGGSSVPLNPPGSMSSEWAVLLSNPGAVEDAGVSRPRTGQVSPAVSLSGSDVLMSFAGNRPVRVALYSLNGAMVLRRELAASAGTVRLTLPGGRAGMHVLRIDRGGHEQVVKINLVP